MKYSSEAFKEWIAEYETRFGKKYIGKLEFDTTSRPNGKIYVLYIKWKYLHIHPHIYIYIYMWFFYDGKLSGQMALKTEYRTTHYPHSKNFKNNFQATLGGR